MASNDWTQFLRKPILNGIDAVWMRRGPRAQNGYVRTEGTRLRELSDAYREFYIRTPYAIPFETVEDLEEYVRRIERAPVRNILDPAYEQQTATLAFVAFHPKLLNVSEVARALPSIMPMSKSAMARSRQMTTSFIPLDSTTSVDTTRSTRNEGLYTSGTASQLNSSVASNGMSAARARDRQPQDAARSYGPSNLSQAAGTPTRNPDASLSSSTGSGRSVESTDLLAGTKRKWVGDAARENSASKRRMREASFTGRADDLTSSIQMMRDKLHQLDEENTVRAASMGAAELSMARAAIEQHQIRSDFEAQQRAFLAVEMERRERVEAVKGEVTRDVLESVQRELSQTIRENVRESIREDIGTIFRQQLEGRVRQQVEEELKRQLVESMRAELVGDLSRQLADNVSRLAGALVQQVEMDVRRQLEDQMRKQYEEMQGRLLEGLTRTMEWVRTRFSERAPVQPSEPPAMLPPPIEMETAGPSTADVADVADVTAPPANGPATTPGLVQSLSTPSTADAGTPTNVVEERAASPESTDSEMTDVDEAELDQPDEGDVGAQSDHHHHDVPPAINHHDGDAAPDVDHQEDDVEEEVNHDAAQQPDDVDDDDANNDDEDEQSPNGDDDDDEETELDLLDDYEALAGDQYEDNDEDEDDDDDASVELEDDDADEPGVEVAPGHPGVIDLCDSDEDDEGGPAAATIKVEAAEEEGDMPP